MAHVHGDVAPVGAWATGCGRTPSPLVRIGSPRFVSGETPPRWPANHGTLVVVTSSESAVAGVRDLLRSRLVAAALTPFDADATIARAAVAGYAAALRTGGASAIAVGAHTGRGAHLDPADLAWLVGEYRQAADLPVVAGLAVRRGRTQDDVLRLAERLRTAGASALLVSPIADSSPGATVTLHERLGAEVGLPLLAFVLYQRASGCQYDAGTVAALLRLPWVCGVKLALLDDAIGCQDILATARRTMPEALRLTGEDRMFGPSLMWGADSALVGIAAAVPSWSVAVLDAWTRQDLPTFVAASARLDTLARLTFTEPMEGYVQRMAWVAAWQGILPDTCAVDPYAPPLPRDERDLLVRALDELA